MVSKSSQSARIAEDRTSARDAAVERALSVLRPPDAQPVPEEFLLREPIHRDARIPGEHPFDQAVFAEAASMTFLRGRVLVFDLDDTLLTTNYICREEWDTPPPGMHPPVPVLSIAYRKMRRSRAYWLKAGWRRPIRARYDSGRYPFLKNPEVIAQVRPGALALLHGLREAGARLVLMTICARERLDFLLDRLPLLRQAFTVAKTGQLRVVCAEDLARIVRDWGRKGPPMAPDSLEGEMADDWQRGRALHVARPRRFSLKTLPALHAGLGLEQLDLLIDDSPGGEEAYREAGLSHRFLKAPRREPFRPVVPDWIRELGKRFTDEAEGAVRESRVDKRFPAAGNYPWVRFEDPLYFPFVHVEEDLPEMTGDEA